MANHMTRHELDEFLATLYAPREHKAADHQRERERSRNLTDAEMARWNTYFENRLAQAIASEHEFMIQVVGEALGEVSNQLGDEIEKTVAAKLEPASNRKLADMMQASFDELKQEISKIRGGLTGEVSDRPIADRRLN
jgi:hypothetical protein